MELRPLVLAILEARPLYGYEIAQRAKRRANLKWEEGTLYPLLHRLEQDGLLSAEWKKAPNGKDRKYYALTRKGKTALAKDRVDWKEQVRVVSQILLGGRRRAPREEFRSVCSVSSGADYFFFERSTKSASFLRASIGESLL